MNAVEILEIVSHLAQKLEENGYTRLAAGIKSARTKYVRKENNKEDQLVNARKLLTNSLINTYNLIYIEEDLINKPLEFLESFGLEDGIYIDGKQEISLRGLKVNQEALKGLRDILNYANRSEYLDENILNGWDLWPQIRLQ